MPAHAVVTKPPRFKVPSEITSEIEARVHRVKGLTAALQLAGLGAARMEHDDAPACDVTQEYGDQALACVADALAEQLDTIVDLAYGKFEPEPEEDTDASAKGGV
jgi:hypothetical protein